ncbi:sensor protein ZraS [bacterium BMS3Abin03]|nr:sensor protein ZraS [bacterium BMS3Abin03]
MRVIKNTDIEYKPFVGTMNYSDDKKNVSRRHPENFEQNDRDTESNDLKEIIIFEKEIEKAGSVLEATEGLNTFLKNKLEVISTQLFFFDKSKTQLIPVGITNNNNTVSFIRHLNSEGSIDWIFQNDSNSNFTELITYTVNGNSTKLIIIPIIQKNKRRGILLLTSLNDVFSNNEKSYNLVQSALNYTLTKIESLLYKFQVKEVTKELQLYQSKNLNDHRLLAVGEMAIGAIEEILNPMQVILSYADMLADENNNSNSDALKIIKEQVSDVTKVISGLMKFAHRDEKSPALQPININNVIKEYHKIISPSVRNKNFELILDLQKNIPMIISNRDYIYQLLTNVFTIVLSGNSSEGGILLQTKHTNNSISIRVISTAYLNLLDHNNSEINSDLSIGIIQKLMGKHEGNLKTSSNPDTGSTLILNFPLQRKKNERTNKKSCNNLFAY